MCVSKGRTVFCFPDISEPKALPLGLHKPSSDYWATFVYPWRKRER